MRNKAISTEKKDRNSAYREGVIAVLINTVLFGLKYWAGIVSGSLALMADAWHTISDSFTSLVVIIATRIAAKPADRRHPFGHGRVEIFGSILISFLLAMVAVNFITEAFARFSSRSEANFGLLAVIVTVISILLKEGLAQYAFRIAAKTGSKTVKADGWHHRSDALSSLVVLIGILLGKYFWWIDSLLGVLVAAMIFYATFEILKNTMNTLLGEVPGEDCIGKIRELAREAGMEPTQLHHFHVHHYGEHTELTFHVYMQDSRTLSQAHHDVNKLEEKIRNQLGMEATIHMEPESLKP